MNGKIVTIISLSVSLVVVVLLSFGLKKSHDETEECRKDLYNEYLINDELYDAICKLETNNNLWFSSLNETVLVDVEGKKRNLENIVDKNSVVYYFDPKRACNTCIEDVVTLLKKKLIPKVRDLVILAEYDKVKDLLSFIYKFDIKFDCYLIQNRIFDPTIEGQNNISHCLFVYDIDLGLVHPFIIKNSSIPGEPYFEKVIEYFHQ